MFDLAALEDATAIVRRAMPPTPQVAWPLLSGRVGCEVVVKHENHALTGAFKVRGGLVFMDGVKRRAKPPAGIVSATRGNHGQSLALAGQRAGVPVTIVAPQGNSIEKNAAMRAYGAELIEAGRDFDQARAEAARLAEERGLEMVPAFHPDLVRGVATYALELFQAAPDLDTVYVAVGMGSGLCGLIRTRDLLGLKTKIVGVVAAGAPAYALSFAAGKAVTTERAETFADGVACRMPCADALEVMLKGADRFVQVTDPEIAAAMRVYYETTHNVAEGAGAAALAALMQERERMRGKKVGVILSGANIDRPAYVRILAAEDAANAAAA